ncbi:MAG: hypothetical protein ACRBFS_24555 [Aureispira sp.]
MRSFPISKSLFIGCSVLLFLLTACGESADRPCMGGEPTAIFEGIKAFENHEFNQTGQESVEKITVPEMNMSIELYQSGCDEIEQEFRILLQEAYELNTPATVCALHLSNILMILSEKEPQKLGALQQWSEAIRIDAERIAYNERIQLSNSSIYIQVDKTHQTNSAILSVVFSQASE